ncbi:MAG: glycoside hydrolase family 3 N-terminal domain-containing protein [Luteibaculaceae bacterium]
MLNQNKIAFVKWSNQLVKSWFVLLMPIFCFCTEPNATQNRVTEIDKKVAALLSQMTLEEKAGQMTNISLMAIAQGEFWMRRDTVALDTAKMREMLAIHHIGSVQNLGTYPFTPAEWRIYIQQIQDFIDENTRLKIPVLYSIDAVHGANYTAGSTLFPHQINMGASFCRETTKKIAAQTAYELKASGIPLNYSPVLDVARNAYWGRFFETFGEDTYLATELGEAYLTGHQGADVAHFNKAAVCLKHFWGYGNAATGRDRTPVYLTENYLRQIHLPPFERAVAMGAKSVMLNSGAVNGIPSHADYRLITEILKQELGFKGFVISDWEDVVNLHKVHQVAENEREAVKLAVNAGLDMCMDPYDASFAIHLVDLVKSGEVAMRRVDDAVSRILKVKYELGLFETLMQPAEKYPDFANEEAITLSLQSALESITLLKNEQNALPIQANETILITGYASNSINVLNGAWSRTWSGQDTTFNDTEKLTIVEAFKANGNKVLFAQGSSYNQLLNLEETLLLANKSDKIVVCLGELPATEKPSDIEDLHYPNAQLALVKALAKTGKPIVLVLVQARPRLFTSVEPIVSAVVNAYLPSNEGGVALAKLLSGQENFSGKLPYTYPKFAGEILPYNHTKADARDKEFGFEGFNPLYEFGFGLSYTAFEYKNLRVNQDVFSLGEPILVSVEVSNVGKRFGKESVLVFLSDVFASEVPAVKNLVYFDKIGLEPGATTTVTFRLEEKALSYVNKENLRIIEPGEFIISIEKLTQSIQIKTKTNAAVLI